MVSGVRKESDEVYSLRENERNTEGQIGGWEISCPVALKGTLSVIFRPDRPLTAFHPTNFPLDMLAKTRDMGRDLLGLRCFSRSHADSLADGCESLIEGSGHTAIATHGLTETFTLAFDQQQKSPAGPPPEVSCTWRFNVYSPGSLKVAVVVNLPLKGVPGGADFNTTFSTGGTLLANFTPFGPRNMIQ